MNTKEAVGYVLHQIDDRMQTYGTTENKLFSEWDILYMIQSSFEDLQYALGDEE